MSADAPSAASPRVDVPLTGEHALVTGSARGIGAAIARRLLCAGARVTLLGRDGAALEQARARLTATPGAAQARGGARAVGSAISRADVRDPAASRFPVSDCAANLMTVTADVIDREAVERAFTHARARFGALTILVNNAGQAVSAPFHQIDAALWRAMLDHNLTGTFHCTQAALPDMLAVGRGRIVNIASTAGLIGYRYVAAYCAAKHGVIGLTRALALELATRGITVNAVCPGYTETDIVRDAIAHIAAKTGRGVQQARAKLIKNNPQRRLVQPDEVAEAVFWLCLPSAASITGQSLPVDGGEVMAG